MSPRLRAPAPATTVLLAPLLLVLCLLGITACGGGDDDAVPPQVQALADRLQQGLDAMADGDVDAARASFDAALEIDATNVLAHYNLGYLAQVEGDARTALAEYATALDGDPAFEPALYNRAILTESSDPDQAVADYRAVLAANPDNAPAHVRLGYLLIHLGDTREGRALVKQGVALDASLADLTPPSYNDRS
ncbi:tetratricopeptide repeat protein [Nocardioides sp.]|uniref:tetratricopeptide repeat protein n=1 Tax=Nocardioides sp. TaxID=35761 RepID=UPI003517226D